MNENVLDIRDHIYAPVATCYAASEDCPVVHLHETLRAIVLIGHAEIPRPGSQYRLPFRLRYCDGLRNFPLLPSRLLAM